MPAFLLCTACAAWLAVGLGSSAASPATFFVSPTGDDTASGATADAPLRTPERAQTLSRAASSPGGGGATVWLLDGVFRLNRTLHFTAADSGTVWSAVPGAKPLLTGSLAVPWAAFEPIESADAEPRLQPEAVGHVRRAKLAKVAPELLAVPGGLGAGHAGWSFRDPDRLQVHERTLTHTEKMPPGVTESKSYMYMSETRLRQRHRRRQG